MNTLRSPETIAIRKSVDVNQAFEIAKLLPDFFDEGGLDKIASDTKNQLLYGAYSENLMVGFATYLEINSETIEMTWLGVLPEYQRSGVGTNLVNESLNDLSAHYKVCQVKTLSENDPYEPYKKTRAFYKKNGFIPIETIGPYPNWGNNPCQIFVRFIGK